MGVLLAHPKIGAGDDAGTQAPTEGTFDTCVALPPRGDALIEWCSWGVPFQRLSDVLDFRSAAAAAHAVDPTAISFRRAAGTAVTHGERGLECVVSFGWGRAVVVKALGGGSGVNSLRDQFGDVDDPLALVDTRFHVVTHSHR